MFTKEDWGQFSSIKFTNFHLEVLHREDSSTVRVVDIPDRLGHLVLGGICTWYAGEIQGYGIDDGLAAVYGEFCDEVAKELGEMDEDHIYHYNFLWDIEKLVS